MNAIKNYFSEKRENLSKGFQEFKALDKKDQRKVAVNKIIDKALYIIIVLLVIVVAIDNPRFVSYSSIINILTLSSTRLIIAFGIAGCVILQGTDLSAGRMVGISAVISASLLQSPTYSAKMYPLLQWLPAEGQIIGQLIATMLIAMLVCGSIGFFSGWVVAKFKLHPFIVTLGTQLIVYGLALTYVTFGNNGGAPLGGLDSRYTAAVTGNLFGASEFIVPKVVVYALLFTIFMWFVWNKTVFGKNMFAVGCNEEAAKVSGVSVFWITISVFAIAGLCYGMGGFLESARVGSNTAATGVNYELDAIAACVIGGVSFAGGVGKISGVIIGVLLLQLINAALVFLAVDGSVTYIVRGAIILVACAIDMRKYLTKK